jgi:hypothetical protein
MPWQGHLVLAERGRKEWTKRRENDRYETSPYKTYQAVRKRRGFILFSHDKIRRQSGLRGHDLFTPDESIGSRTPRLRTHKKEIDIGEEDEMRSLFYG